MALTVTPVNFTMVIPCKISTICCLYLYLLSISLSVQYSENSIPEILDMTRPYTELTVDTLLREEIRIKVRTPLTSLSAPPPLSFLLISSTPLPLFSTVQGYAPQVPTLSVHVVHEVQTTKTETKIPQPADD